MVSFGWPWALLLLPLPLFVTLARRRERRTAIAVPPLLAEALDVTETRSGPRTIWLAALLWIGWALLVGAIAQPALIAGSTINSASGHAMVVVIDLSSSMERTDFELDGKPVDRLTALKSVARAFIAARQGDRIGLVLFGDEALVAAPISYDLASISNALEESAIGMVGRATAIGDALGLAIVKLRDDPAAEKAIVLLSDGTNNSGQAEPEDAARLAKQFGIRVQTVGMGSMALPETQYTTDFSADLDEATLKRIAEESGGQYFRASTTTELKAVYDIIDRLETSESDAPPVVPRIDVRNWLLLPLGLLLGVIGLVLGWRRPA
jgi:Ca-activated chloride channel family protein